MSYYLFTEFFDATFFSFFLHSQVTRGHGFLVFLLATMQLKPIRKADWYLPEMSFADDPGHLGMCQKRKKVA